MPYQIRKIRYKGKSAYKVVDKFKKKVHAKHTTLKKAKAQIKLLSKVDLKK
jgi:hypothetical protein